MKRSVWSSLLLGVIFLGLFAFLGCESETEVSGPTGPGEIAIHPKPLDYVDLFPWTLTGPGGFSQTGNGDVSVENLDPGVYTLTWGNVNGWVTPVPTSDEETLTSGAIASFTATYRQTGEALADEVQINPDPNDLNDGDGAPWSVTGPNGFSESGSGDTNFADRDPGDYTITWGAVDGWVLSSPESGAQTLTLVEGEGVNFLAEYFNASASSFEFVDVPAGEFKLGSSSSDSTSLPYEWPQHTVTLTRGFQMAVSEVTWAQFVRVMGYNPSFYFEINPEFPWEAYGCDSITWLEAIEFCNTLSLEEGFDPAYVITGELVTWDRDANGYRLPTEAEWEYACRAGSDSPLYNGNIEINSSSCYFESGLEEIAWYCSNAQSQPHEVKQLDPNAWGLYDMSGNLWEWTWDVNESYDSVPMYLMDYLPEVGADPISVGGATITASLAGFGDQQVLRLIEANAMFGISNLGVTSTEVRFTYLDFEGNENFKVNNLPAEPFVGQLVDLPTDLVPGVTISVTTTPTTHDTFGEGVIGEVVLTGDISSIEIGGSLFWIDSIEVSDADVSAFGHNRLVDFDLVRLNSPYLPDDNPITAELVLGCSVVDPSGVVQLEGSPHMLRGGSYISEPRRCRSAIRSEPDKGLYAGFRFVRNLD